MKSPDIKHVLMCEPVYLDRVGYSINPWMQVGPLDQQKAHAQWNNLKKTYNRLGIQTDVIPQQPGQPDMVFAADQGIVQGGAVILGNFKHAERQGETPHYRTWFQEQGYDVKELPPGTYFEGNGESYRWNDTLFLGVGHRSDKKTVDALQDFFPQEVIPLEIIDPHFYHLDVGFFPLNSETVFYYPPAFSEASQQELRARIPHLEAFTEKEARGFSGNSVVTGEHVVYQEGNDTFAKKLVKLGYTPVGVDLSEFKKLGGGAHCLTNILEERFEN